MGRDDRGGVRERLVAFLRTPSSYAHRPAEVQVIETHASWVFIVSPLVFKVKKPVALGFLDFSTLEKRRHFCQRELELNRRLCPDVYLAVLPIYRRGDGFSFDERGGEVVEYALQMRELRHGSFMRELLAKGAIGETEINRVLARLHRFYEAQAPTPEIEAWGAPEKLKISTDENFTQVDPFVGQTLSPAAFPAVCRYTNDFYAAHAELFRERMEQGRIRDCHGDLHLDHIHLTAESVSIFDCIEFNDRFRFIDVANDLAFLAMDLDFERHHRLSDLLLRHAVRDFHDPGMLRLADFYKCYRAFVRGKVESLQMKSDEHARRARRYFQLSLRYAAIGSEPVLVAVMGRVATGKSTVAKELAREFDWRRFSSDEIRKTMARIPLEARTPRELRLRVYSEEMTGATYAKLGADGIAAVTRDGGVVLDATFSRRAVRDRLRRECAQAGIRLQFLELQVGQEEMARRLASRDEAAAAFSDARLEDLEMLNAAYEQPQGEPDVLGLSTSGSMADSMQELLLHLAGRRATAAG